MVARKLSQIILIAFYVVNVSLDTTDMVLCGTPRLPVLCAGTVIMRSLKECVK